MTPVERAEQILTLVCGLVDDLARAETAPAPKQDNRKKLSQREVQLARQMYRSGIGVVDIARSFDCHHATISRTVRGVYHK